ncbi:MAG TPA: biotin--[acetyl-CoA-carboxylase] ligase [Bacteroidia bacterium]|jgi:BirA family biotin operon repressor/biotin-[acetyl-CoA-carboxylase] ligase|nr:biotin--[acetyl-CoA-carboxylase] ligase [Bacteroidia bacterium]
MRLHTLFIGHPIKILEQVDSTNSYALNLVRDKPPAEGCIIWAKEQLAGRGQRGTQWSSEALANLTFSLILRPQFLPIAEQFQLTKAIALGIAGFVSHILENSTDVKIKWPNDIYVKNCKIAGILIENVLEQSTMKYSVVGIGLNVNQTLFDPSIPNPASLKSLTGKDFNTEDCLLQLCSFIEKQYLDLRAANYEQLDEAYRNLLYRRGIEQNFTLKDEPYTGKIEGVNQSGHLLIQKKLVNNSYETIQVTDSKQLVFL